MRKCLKTSWKAPCFWWFCCAVSIKPFEDQKMTSFGSLSSKHHSSSKNFLDQTGRLLFAEPCLPPSPQFVLHEPPTPMPPFKIVPTGNLLLTGSMPPLEAWHFFGLGWGAGLRGVISNDRCLTVSRVPQFHSPPSSQPWGGHWCWLRSSWWAKQDPVSTGFQRAFQGIKITKGKTQGALCTFDLSFLTLSPPSQGGLLPLIHWELQTHWAFEMEGVASMWFNLMSFTSLCRWRHWNPGEELLTRVQEELGRKMSVLSRGGGGGRGGVLSWSLLSFWSRSESPAVLTQVYPVSYLLSIQFNKHLFSSNWLNK